MVPVKNTFFQEGLYDAVNEAPVELQLLVSKIVSQVLDKLALVLND